jgi:hypothetical protein
MASGAVDERNTWRFRKAVRSIPPSGKCKILNIYWDPEREKIEVEYDDNPEP